MGAALKSTGVGEIKCKACMWITLQMLLLCLQLFFKSSRLPLQLLLTIVSSCNRTLKLSQVCLLLLQCFLKLLLRFILLLHQILLLLQLLLCGLQLVLQVVFETDGAAEPVSGLAQGICLARQLL